MKKYDSGDHSKATRPANDPGPKGNTSFPHGTRVNVEGQKGTHETSKSKKPAG